MGTIVVSNLGKAYKQYPNRWSRLLEWVTPGNTKRHNLKWVLQDISFTVNAGESMAIMGINGAGKSTLLKLITGTTQPTTGSVHMTGRVAAMLELGMGFHPDFTGRQNAFMAGQLLGIAGEDIARLMPEIESFAEIGDYIDQPVRVYSSGMQVRLAFSVATAIRPDILIVDEALSVGDAYFQAKCYQRINRYKKEGTTLLLVSHSPGDVVKHCNRAVLLKNGVLALDGASRDVSNRYMDELFGKKSTQGEVVVEEVSTTTVATGARAYETLLHGKHDIFHTHPGYLKEEHRWGHGGAVILDYLVTTPQQEYPTRIEGGSETDFYFKVKFNADFSSVVPGFLIKTLEGIFLYGTNSFVSTAQVNQISVESGDTKIFRFSMPMALNEGHYLISFGISSGNPLEELTPLDRRYDSVMINVGRSLQFWGIVDLSAQFECLQASTETLTA
jgi:lipopolysaccharide transport system ATP-binding protein